MSATVTSYYAGEVNGKPVAHYRLVNSCMSVVVSEYGATVMSIQTPDKDGVCEEITLQCKSLNDIVEAQQAGTFPYFGSVVGRVANRIAKGTFELDKTVYTGLGINNGPNSLHGGAVGFDQKIFDSQAVQLKNATGVTFSYKSMDGEENYPGTVCIKVQYLLTNDNKMVISYSGEALDKPTLLNLTNHCYFNLSGNFKRSTLDHTLQLSCNRYLPVDEFSIPTGNLQAVSHSPFDFTTTKPLGKAAKMIG
jgi:aldose 1-epimerase